MSGDDTDKEMMSMMAEETVMTDLALPRSSPYTAHPVYLGSLPAT